MWRVFGHWRRRSDYCFVLFTTSLVVTTISFTMWRELSWLRLTSVLILGPSLLIWSDLSSLIGLVPLLWRCVSDQLLWSARFYCSPPWNRMLAPRIEDTLLKGNFSIVVQVVTGITFVNIRCSDNNCLPSRCLWIATILLSNVTCIWEPLRRKWPYLSQ
jgi:hypothetical protein